MKINTKKISKLIFTVLAIVGMMACSFGFSGGKAWAAKGGSVSTPAGHPSRVVDSADLLSTAEEAQLRSRLNEISESHGIDVSVVTVNKFSQASAMEAADDYYDYNGYGLGEDHSGLMLFISMEDRDWWITTTGEAIKIFTDSKISSIGDDIVPYLSAGDYAGGFGKFASDCDYYINDHFTYHWKKYLGISLVVGFIVAAMYVGSLKGQLKSVAPKNQAADYVVRDSMHVTNSRDIFLYHTVSKVAKQTSSGGGSSTHTSSSGTSHGGGGGKF